MERTKLDMIRNREDLAACITELRGELHADPSRWENNNLSSFLEALAAWIQDMDGYYKNQNQPVPERPQWKTIAEMLVAATMYE